MLKRDLYYERIPTKSLRDDVRLLGNILGRVIKEQEGQKFYDLVEKIRLLSKANIANKNRKDPFKKILNEIKKLPPHLLFKLTRAFNHFMNFYNLAESIDASRTLDLYENVKQEKKFQNIFIEEIFENFFKNKKISNNKIYNIAKSLNIGIVSHKLSSIIASPHLASSAGVGLDLLISSVFHIIVISSKTLRSKIFNFEG